MMGFDVCAHVSITLRDPKLLSEAIEELKKVPEIDECHFITEAANILAKLYCVDNEHLMRTIFDRIPAHPGPRLDRNHDLATGGFPARNQHRLHRGVTPPGPPNPVRSVSEYHPEHSGVVFFSADGTLRPPDIPLI